MVVLVAVLVAMVEVVAPEAAEREAVPLPRPDRSVYVDSFRDFAAVLRMVVIRDEANWQREVDFGGCVRRRLVRGALGMGSP